MVSKIVGMAERLCNYFHGGELDSPYSEPNPRNHGMYNVVIFRNCCKKVDVHRTVRVSLDLSIKAGSAISNLYLALSACQAALVERQYLLRDILHIIYYCV